MRLFYPSSSVPPQYFIGRNSELTKILEGLASTKEGNGQNFIVYGKKGIGKTTLLKYVNTVATSSESAYYGGKFNFITLSLIMRNEIDLVDFLRLIIIEIEDLKKNEGSNIVRRATKEFWESIPISSINILGIGLDLERESHEIKNINIIKNLLFKTVKELLRKTKKRNYDGLLIMLDEANYLENNSYFSDFFRELILEINKVSTDNNLMIILAGHSPSQPNWLDKSRNTNFVRLSKFTSNEIITGLEHKYFRNFIKDNAIDLECIKIIKAFSKGHPFLFQKFGYFLEKNSVKDRLDATNFIWGIFHPKYYDHELKRFFNEEEYLEKDDKTYLTRQINKIIKETFDTLAPGNNFHLSKFWDMYFTDPENLYLNCQNEILTYWLNFKNQISDLDSKHIFNESWEENPLIINWLTREKEAFYKKTAEFVLKNTRSISLAFSNYYFCHEGMNSTYAIADRFLDESLSSDENAKAVWVEIVRICEYLVPLVMLNNSSISFNEKIKSPLNDESKVIIDSFKEEINDTVGYDKVPKRINEIGQILKKLNAFQIVEQYNL